MFEPKVKEFTTLYGNQVESFLALYDEVFNSDGSVKPCGRFKCMNLIESAKQLEKDIDFGDMQTGFMRIVNIKALYNKVCVA